MAFPTYRLPPGVEEGATGGPAFQTLIQEAISGREQRVSQWAKARAKFEIGYGILDLVDADGAYRAVLALFYAHMGRRYPFKFKDWGDYEAIAENFGTGDGSDTTFQLKKTYDPSLILLSVAGSRTYSREIYLLSNTPVIKVNGVTVATPADYSISATGLVTFAVAPTTAHPLTWTGEFDIPVRFDMDELPAELTEISLASYRGIMLREVVGADELA